MGKTARLFAANVEDDYFGDILICAVRYCIGRETYMPGLVTDWIEAHCAWKLNRRVLEVMRRDIQEAEMRNALGEECDRKTWMDFLAWIVGELMKLERKQNETD